MKASRRNYVILAVGIIALGLLIWYGMRPRGDLVEEYRAKLRAQGEKISFVELGFPRPPQNADGLVRLTNAVRRLPSVSFDPGSLDFMHFTAPGRTLVSHRQAQPLWAERSRSAAGQNSWDELGSAFAGAADLLAEIRLAVEQPIRWFRHNPTNDYRNALNEPRFPFVPMRNAAQWLAADAIVALHVNDRARALSNVHALVQLTEFHREDPELVAQMIRVAIAGLGVAVTREVLQCPELTESDLALMQADWEKVDLLSGLEVGFLGARAMADSLFSEIVERGALQAKHTSLPVADPSFRERLEETFAAFLWQFGDEEDMVLAFRHFQQSLENIRGLQRQKPWPEVDAELQGLLSEIQAASTGLRKYRHPVSSLLLPNYSRAIRSVVRQDTQRRLTITVIALKRYQLQHRQFPAELNELVPAFLTVVPMDPMSGRPLRYRRNADGSFTLYSVGEDGKDDGGDPNSSSPVTEYDLWSGRDAVWPVSETLP
ncbi:MAG: hypothetical protein KIS67_26110 [Verrucomicrobiae bacterium]|nr:hypothetical protein [Verrucomicrobiae bacterium]